MPRRHPLPRDATHAVDLTPCQQTHAVHLVRCLPIHHATTLRDVQLIRTPGAQHPVRSAPGSHGPQPAELAGHDDLPHLTHDCARTAGTAAEELHAVPLCSLD